MSDSTSTRKPRKKADTSSGDGDDDPSGSGPVSAIPHTVSTGKVPGPPYVCPSCQTTYSRLEYLRRHERRHADIRPFVCECGKGFSRSDVLKRHRRQCASVPHEEEGDGTAAKKGPGKTKKAAAGEEGGSAPKKRKVKSKKEDENEDEDEMESAKGGSQSKPPPNKRNTGPSGIQQQQPQSSGLNQQQQQFHQAQQQQHNSGTYAQWNGPNLGHGYRAQGREPDYGGQKPPPPVHAYMQSGGPPPLHAQISSLSQLHSNQAGNNYPSSPESNASNLSPHTSPRNNHRDINRPANGGQGGAGMIRYGSGSGLREQIAQGRGRSTPPPPPPSTGSGSRHAYPGPEFWNAIDPSLEGGRSDIGNDKRNGRSNGKLNDSSDENQNLGSSSNTSRTSSEVFTSNGSRGGMSAGVGAGVGMAGYAPQNSATGGPAFSFPSGEQFNASSSQNSSSMPSRSNHPTFESGSVGGGSALASREPQRFSFSTGPLSPFSNAALNSSTSPYLSAFSNARDTPLVSSPRGSTSGAPGTPGGSGNNSFDWSMRPPKQPANRGSTGGTGVTPGAIASQAPSSSGNVTSDTPTKRGPQTKRLSVGSSASGNPAQGIAAPLPAGVTSASAGGGGGTHTPSRFVSRSTGGQPNNYFDFSSEGSSGSVAANATPSTGPDAFLMSALNGGGISDSRINASEHNSSNLSTSIPSSGLNMAALFGLNSNGQSTTPATPLWDFANMPSGQTPAGFSGNTPSFGLSGPLTNSNQQSSLGWLMSPSIQQLLNSFSEPAGGNVSPSPRPTLSSHDSYFPPQRPLTESQVAAGLDDDPNFQAILNSQSESASARASTNTGSENNSGAPTGTISNMGPATSSAVGNPSASPSHGMGVATPGGTGSLALERAFKDIANPFFIPPTLFRSCYAIAHWALPPITRLSMLALHSQQNLLKHFPILHEPTFRLDSTPGCLAFSTCMLGCHEAGRKWWAGEEVVARNPNAFPSTTSNPNRDPNASNLIDEEDGQELVKPVVMNEKMDMLEKSFSTRCRALKDKVSVVQALLLWRSNNLLSSDESLRSTSASAIGKIVGLARSAGLFDPAHPHVCRKIEYTAEEVLKTTISESSELSFSFSFLPSYLPGCSDEEKLWRRWSEYEGRRRTCHLLWILDTVSALDEDIAMKASSAEFKHLPLPSPDSIWRTSTVNSWKNALDEYKGPTVEEAVKQLFSGKNAATPKSNVNGNRPDSSSSSDARTSSASSSSGHGDDSSSIFGAHGPFARTVLIITILRGMLEMIDSKNCHSEDASSFMDQYIDKEQKTSPPPGAAPIENKEMSIQVCAYRSALALWRKAWDQDKLCRDASGPNFRINPFSPSRLAPGNESEVKFKSVTASGAVPLCDDALPFYWLAHVLLGHVANNKKLPSRLVKKSADAPKNGEKTQEAVDFRSMLRFAKQFVLNGEGQNQSISNNSK